MKKRILINFDVIVPSHISEQEFSDFLVGYINLFRFTTEIKELTVYPAETELVISPIFPGTSHGHN